MAWIVPDPTLPSALGTLSSVWHGPNFLTWLWWKLLLLASKSSVSSLFIPNCHQPSRLRAFKRIIPCFCWCEVLEVVLSAFSHNNKGVALVEHSKSVPWRFLHTRLKVFTLHLKRKEDTTPLSLCLLSSFSCFSSSSLCIVSILYLNDLNDYSQASVWFLVAGSMHKLSSRLEFQLLTFQIASESRTQYEECAGHDTPVGIPIRCLAGAPNIVLHMS